MPKSEPPTIAQFVDKWQKSEASERANKDAFLIELCDVLEVGRPEPATGDPKRDVYVFEAPVSIKREQGDDPVGFMDLYKKESFILEAKQGSTSTGKKIGTARRGTGGWHLAMQEARGQALKYATHVEAPPPFLMVCDIGYCFDIFATLDGTTAYREFPTPQAFRIYFKDFEKNAELFRRIFSDPLGLDPSKQSVKVTRDVAAQLAKLSRSLETDGHHPELVATFLMRCIFTMFAEDAGLLPDHLFTHLLKEYWIKNPPSFPGGVMGLWKEMNSGGQNVICGKILEFNGGLFRDPQAPKLTVEQLGFLLNAAKHDWSDVEPAIFGTLIERALDPKERHALGAHFTPKAYVERLVRPTIEEPLRADWDVVKAEVRHLVEEEEEEKARAVLRKFHVDLCKIRVLDPACGSGNFLYVTMEMMKRLEGEVLAMLDGLGDKQFRFEMQHVTVNPSQFLGIEIKRWSKEIAELVLWIGYLQWHLKAYGRGERKVPVPEPVLKDYKNIECRDAVLAHDKEELLRDEKGVPVSRWDGKTMKTHPVTGEDVPDESARIPIYLYVNPRKAEWPKADFIVGNPPFIGDKVMKTSLGEGYVMSLRDCYDNMSGSCDYVMYWWNRAATVVSSLPTRRFGFIATNSFKQNFNRRSIQPFFEGKDRLSLVFAVPDHPWVESEDGAAVRISMTVAEKGEKAGTLQRIVSEVPTEGLPEIQLMSSVGFINVDLTTTANVALSKPLKSNQSLSCPGVKLFGQGFVVSQDEAKNLGLKENPILGGIIRPYRIARNLTQRGDSLMGIDLLGYTEEEVHLMFPRIFQHLITHVKPERDSNNRESYRRNWWLFGEPRKEFRKSLIGLDRYFVTPETSKHRFFTSLPSDTIAEGSLIIIASDDAFFLGVLSSRLHVVWALAAGGRLGVGNDPRYNKSRCFDPFPFPVCDEKTKRRIRDVGESLDAHRKQQQAQYPDLTITGMYNVLEKLRSGDALNAKEKTIHEQGLISILKKIHDDLDDAVFEAYGWPHDLTDEEILERLVDLNSERAEEEKRGLVRWLRPEYQLKAVKGAAPEPEQQEIAATKKEIKRPSAPPAMPAAQKQPWPKSLPERIVAIRDLITGTKEAWTAEAVARSFVRGQVKSAVPVLESLAAVGVLFEYDSGGVRTWRVHT